MDRHNGLLVKYGNHIMSIYTFKNGVQTYDLSKADSPAQKLFFDKLLDWAADYDSFDEYEIPRGVATINESAKFISDLA